MGSDTFSNLRVRTPEGIDFSLVLAGPLVRFLALLVDLACISGATSLAGTLVRYFIIVSPDLAVALMVLAGFLVSMGYGILLEWFWRGKTVGKMLFRLRVMDREGLHLQPGQVVLRNLMRVVDAMPVFYLLGGAFCFFSRLNQRLGDIAAGTIVVRTPKTSLPDLERLSDDRYNSLRAYPALVSRLRQTVSGDEASIALRAVLRRDRMEPEARRRLFGELAEHFRSLVTCPDDAFTDIADERYVRNVLDIVYNVTGPTGQGRAGA